MESIGCMAAYREKLLNQRFLKEKKVLAPGVDCSEDQFTRSIRTGLFSIRAFAAAALKPTHPCQAR